MSNISSVSQSNTNILVNGSEIVDQNTAAGKQIEVKMGATIQGTVVSVSDTEDGKIANINVGDGQIQAKLSDSMSLREGQTLNFVVRGTGSNGVTISPLYENTSADQSTLKALSAAGIEITNDTIQMVKEMMETGLSIDRSSLLDMSKNLSMYPNTSISTMVEMKSLNIPVTENNIEQFGSYKSYEHQVISDMTQIMDALPGAFSELAESGNVSGAINLYGEVLKLFAEGASIENAVTDGNVASYAVAEESLTVNSDTEGLAAENASVSVEGEMGSLEEATGKAGVLGTAEENASNTNVVSAEATEEATTNATLIKGEVQETTGSPDDSSKALPNGEQTEKGNAAASIQTSEGAVENVAAAKADTANVDKLFSQSFLDNLRNLNVSEKAIESLSKDQGLLFKELAAAFDEAKLSNPVEAAAWKKLFSSDEYNKLLKDNIESQWLLKPGDVEKKENIENLYQRLGSQAKALADAINNSPMANSNLGQAANNLSNNLDFMNQLNQMFQYVQLPLQMTGQNVHGDLYVYQNKHKKLSEDGSVSAVLHLDMENLGPVDVFVKLLDTKVTTNFYVMDDEVLTLINDNIHILNERLEKRGYTMQVSLKLHDDIDGQDAAVDEMLDVTRTPVLSTASFDARA